MKKASEIIGLPILNVENGTIIGRVSELVLDPQQGRITTLLLADNLHPAKSPLVLPVPNIDLIGTHAIVVHNQNALVPLIGLPNLIEVLEQRIFLRDNSVYSDQGDRLGKVIDYSVEPPAFNLVTLHLQRGPLGGIFSETMNISARRIKVIGRDAIIVCPDNSGQAKQASPNSGQSAEPSSTSNQGEGEIVPGMPTHILPFSGHSGFSLGSSGNLSRYNQPTIPNSVSPPAAPLVSQTQDQILPHPIPIPAPPTPLNATQPLNSSLVDEIELPSEKD